MRNQPQPPSPGAQPSGEDRHELDIEEREAYQYWGYLFKADKTGTDKLKGLLRGLKDLMNQNYEPTDSPDLTPTQLAYFYRELNGNYDQLFLGTPSESIAFIYKSLGCLYSLQPLSKSTAFTEPTVPALKTEGWIMWQTIQLLLGPEEHSGFLREALQKWNVKDPTTGETFPNLLPRSCFPMQPDKHMVAWYDGVSERLRKEAEEEERQREIEAEQAEVRRLPYRRQRDGPEDNESIDSRGPALAYFRNPLYHHEGRSTVVRPSSKRPQLSPRRSSMKDKAKDGATTVGHVIRNIGSPHLWDGRHSKSESRERSKDRRRRSSLPDNRYQQTGDRPVSGNYDGRRPSYGSGHHHRSRSGQQPNSEMNTIENENHDTDANATPPASGSRNQEYDQTLRHSKSHEPTPSQREYSDYFQDHDDDPNPTLSAGVTPNNIGPSFEPSASPLFASSVAKQPQPKSHRPSVDFRNQPVPDFRRPQSQNPPYSRSPPDSSSFRPRDRDNRRYASQDRHRSSSRPYHEGRSPPRSAPSGRAHGDHTRRPSDTPPYPTGSGMPRFGPSPDRNRRHSNRMSGSDLARYNSGGGGGDGPSGGSGEESPRRNGPQKHARFAQGVDGRRYPNESGWR